MFIIDVEIVAALEKLEAAINPQHVHGEARASIRSSRVARFRIGQPRQ
ncbi:hypothetical protein [Bradyrhizobium sp. CSS354]|nr:hypothetical protein [Bradyrhizobium sp. CSS354]MDE5466082.1 hypothetical protein [Bradyrhizobium sp. CSS354]